MTGSDGLKMGSTSGGKDAAQPAAESDAKSAAIAGIRMLNLGTDREGWPMRGRTGASAPHGAPGQIRFGEDESDRASRPASKHRMRHGRMLLRADARDRKGTAGRLWLACSACHSRGRRLSCRRDGSRHLQTMAVRRHDRRERHRGRGLRSAAEFRSAGDASPTWPLRPCRAEARKRRAWRRRKARERPPPSLRHVCSNPSYLHFRHMLHPQVKHQRPDEGEDEGT